MSLEVWVLFVGYGVFMAIFGILFGYVIARYKFFKEIDSIIKRERKMAINFSRAVIKGRVSEQLFPLTPFFNYNLSDARFLGSPVDYIVFNGYSNSSGDNPYISEVVFVEVKTGKSQLSPMELAIKDAIDNRRVRFEVVYIGDRISYYH